MCQGLIAPQFAGLDLGLAGKLAVRAVASATGVGPGQVGSSVRETGDLAQAAPLEIRYLLRLVTGGLRLGITPTILDALAQVHAGGRAARPELERAYNICCDLGKVASILVTGGVAAVERLQVRPGNPVRAMLAQRLSDPAEILAKLGGQCAAEYKYDGVRVQGAQDRRRPDRAVHPAAGTSQFAVPRCRRGPPGGLGPSEAIVEGEVVALDASAGELRPFGEVTFRRRKHGPNAIRSRMPRKVIPELRSDLRF